MRNFTIILAAAIGTTSISAAAPAQAQDFYLGQIITTGYTFCPRGTVDADGRLLNIGGNPSLYSLYGTQFGGDGRTTFGVPDLNEAAKGKNKPANPRYCVVTSGTFPSRT